MGCEIRNFVSEAGKSFFNGGNSFFNVGKSFFNGGNSGSESFFNVGNSGSESFFNGGNSVSESFFNVGNSVSESFFNGGNTGFKISETESETDDNEDTPKRRTGRSAKRCKLAFLMENIDTMSITTSKLGNKVALLANNALAVPGVMPDLQGDAAPAWAVNMEERISAGSTTQITNCRKGSLPEFLPCL